MKNLDTKKKVLPAIKIHKMRRSAFHESFTYLHTRHEKFNMRKPPCLSQDASYYDRHPSVEVLESRNTGKKSELVLENSYAFG